MSYDSENNDDHESHFGTTQSNITDHWNEMEHENNINADRKIRRKRKKRFRSQDVSKSMISHDHLIHQQENGSYNLSLMHTNVDMNMGMNLNIPTQDFIPGHRNESLAPMFPMSLSTYENEQQIDQGFKQLQTKKLKKVKKSKRHRKRHLLPGPAGAIQLTSESSLLSKSKSSTSIEESTNKLKNTSRELSMTQHHDSNPDEMKLTISSSSIPTIIGTIIRIQEHPAWKSMCVALSRYTPHISQYYYNCCSHPLFPSNTNNITKKISTNKADDDHTAPRLNLSLAKFLRFSIPNDEYATIAEIHQGMHDCFVSKFLVVYISNVYLHSHCDYTCECMDESGMAIDGWINEQFVKERQEEAIEIGAVLLLKRIALTIYQKTDEEFEGGEEGNDFYLDDLDDVSNNIDRANKNVDQNTRNNQANKVNNIQRMLLIGEETVVCWWKASDAANVTYNEEIHLMKKRDEMWNKIANNNKIFPRNKQNEINDDKEVGDILVAESVTNNFSPAKSQTQNIYLSDVSREISKNSLSLSSSTQISKNSDLNIDDKENNIILDRSSKILKNSLPLDNGREMNITIDPESLEQSQMLQIEKGQNSLLMSQSSRKNYNYSHSNEGNPLALRNSLHVEDLSIDQNKKAQTTTKSNPYTQIDVTANDDSNEPSILSSLLQKKQLSQNLLHESSLPTNMYDIRKESPQLPSGANKLSNKSLEADKLVNAQYVRVSQNTPKCDDTYADLSNKDVHDESILSISSTSIPTKNNLLQDCENQHKLVQNPYQKSKSRSCHNMVSIEKKQSQQHINHNAFFSKNENLNEKSLNLNESLSPSNEMKCNLEKKQRDHNPNFDVNNPQNNCSLDNSQENNNLGGFRQSLWTHFEDEMDAGLNEESEKKDFEELGHFYEKDTEIKKIHESTDQNSLATNGENINRLRTNSVLETVEEPTLSQNHEQPKNVSLFENANMFDDIDLGNDDLSEDD